MRISHRQYLAVLLIVLGIGLGGIALFNFLVDPYDIYPWIGLKRLDRYRTALGHRISKAEALRQKKWDIIIVGSSRVEVGMDPEHPAFAGRKVYNDGLSATNFIELHRSSRLALENAGLKRLVLCVDMFGFYQYRATHPDFRMSILDPALNPVEYHLTNLLSIHATQYSISTIKNARRQEQGMYWPFGLRRDERRPPTRHADWRLDQYYDFAFPGELRRSTRQLLSQERLDELTQLLKDASDRGIPVDVVEPPMHAIQVERLINFSDYEEWLRRVVPAVERANSSSKGPKATLWEFFQYNAMTEEPFPGPGDPPRHMRWFFDTIHFKKETGDRVIEEMFGSGTTNPAERLGLVLTSKNLEAHIEKLRHDRAEYVQSHPIVGQLIEDARAHGKPQ